MRKLLIIILILFSSVCNATIYYVATTGNDSNPGTISQPWATWQKAFDTAEAGDTVYFRGGTWYPSSRITGISGITIIDPTGSQGTARGNNGDDGNPICFFNYPGETPVLDCKNVSPSTWGLIGINVFYAQNIHFRGLEVRNVYQRIANRTARGIDTYGGRNFTYERMNIHHISGPGIRHVTGWINATDTVKFLYCDSHHNADSLSTTPGNSADGWKVDNDTIGYTYFYQCRAYKNSDDGYDVSDHAVVKFEECWSFANGYLAGGNGSGFKLSPANAGYANRLVYKCLSAYNVVNFEENTGAGAATAMWGNVFNCTSYGSSGEGGYRNQYKLPLLANWYKNNVSYNDANVFYQGNVYKASHNTWKYYAGYPGWQVNDTVGALSSADFVSVDSTGISGARGASGSLPVINFLRPAASSKLIDKGIDVGLVYNGSAPDLGYTEYNESGTDITAVTFLGVTAESSVVNSTNHTVAVVVPFGTSLTLTPIITHNGASISPASGVSQDFSSPVSYTVTAVDDTSQAWTVSVSVGAAPTVEGGFMRIGNKYAKIGTKFAK